MKPRSLPALLLSVCWCFSAPVHCQTAQKEAPPHAATVNLQREEEMGEIDNLIDPESHQLPALATIIDKLQIKLTGKCRQVTQFTGIEVLATNSTDRSLLIDGNETLLSLGAERLKPVTRKEVEATLPASDKLEPRKILKNIDNGIAGFATIGALPTVQDQERQRKPVRQRYGSDEKFREQEQTRFGKRVLFPGDTSSGFIYYPGTFAVAKGTTIEFTVHDLNNQKDIVSLVAR
jgi:hypothetical protein